jgi:hypothetical protein
MKKIFAHTALVLLTTVCLIACSPPADKNTPNTTSADTTAGQTQTTTSDSLTSGKVPTDQLITPGKSIGHIVLGEDQAAAIAQLGKPDFGDAAMGSSLVTWYSKKDSAKYQTSIFSSKNFGAKDENIARIKKILVTSPWFKTTEKLGVGSAFADISQSYQLKSIHTAAQEKDSVTTFTDLGKGISFEIDKASKCVGVIVHGPGEEAGTYLDMHQK